MAQDFYHNIIPHFYYYFFLLLFIYISHNLGTITFTCYSPSTDREFTKIPPKNHSYEISEETLVISGIKCSGMVLTYGGI